MVYWREHFASWILERGYDYFLDGRVTEVKEDDYGYTGIVSGSEEYSVKIENIDDFPDDEELLMYCTCPHANGGANCKHMAAMLYAIEASENLSDNDSEHDYIVTSKNSITSERPLKEVLDSLSPEVLKSELNKVLEDDENLRISFLIRYSRDKSNMTRYINSMQNTARKILRECADHHGFVNWRNASTYTSRLISEVIDGLHDFITSDKEETQMAFDVSLYVLDLFATTDIDDDGDTQVITDECIGLWGKILENNNDEHLGKDIYSKLTGFCEKIGLGEYISMEIENFVSDYFDDGHFLTDRLAILDKRIERFENNEQWNGAYILSQAVMERLRLMEELEKPENEIKEFKNKYWHLPCVREVKINELEVLEDWRNLISLLEECKAIDCASPGLIRKYSWKLVENYCKTGAVDMARNELYKYVVEYGKGEVSAYNELKKYYSAEEWVDMREDILKHLESKHIDIKPLLAEDGLKGRLMYLLVDSFEKNRSMAKFILPEIWKYEKDLRPDFDRKLLDLHYEIIMKMAEFTGGRSHYKEVVAALKRMLVYPGGKERVDEMKATFFKIYYNRPATKQELSVL